MHTPFLIGDGGFMRVVVWAEFSVTNACSKKRAWGRGRFGSTSDSDDFAVPGDFNLVLATFFDRSQLFRAMGFELGDGNCFCIHCF